VPAHPFGARQMALERLPSAIGFTFRIKIQHYSGASEIRCTFRALIS
jgi:hypothetical protein